MMSRNDHIIQRLILQLQLDGAKDRIYALQHALKECLKERVAQQLDDLFSGLIPENEVVRIPRLEVDLGVLSGAKMTRNFEQSCLAAIEEELRHTVGRNQLSGGIIKETPRYTGEVTISRLSLAESRYGQFEHFLQCGELPWWRGSWEAWETSLLEQLLQRERTALRIHLQRTLRRQPAQINRLLWQFSTHFLEQLLDHAEPKDTQGIPLGDRNDCRQRWRQILVSDNGSVRATSESGAVENVSPATTKPATNGHDASPVREGNTSDAEEVSRHDLYITNAGLAILLPCLYSLFRALGYLDSSRRFATLKQQVEAIHVLQYLATGETDVPERELVLNKLVCGLPLSEPIPRFVGLEAEVLQMADQFVAAIIAQVPKWKNTSVAGLRHSFLQREGRLRYRAGYWHLKVQQQSFDPFLLDELPWGLSMVKFRWMPERLQIEWI